MRGPTPVPLAQRFYAKVAFDNPTRCWEWTAYRNNDGYGVISVGPRQLGLAHRVSFSLWHGRDPRPDAEIMHSCDRPACVNPYHLVEGTHQQNMRDCGAKGRIFAPPGERNPRAKLRDADIPIIRERALAGETSLSLALEYGVSEGLIQHVKKGRRR